MKKKHFLSLFLLAPIVVFFAGPRPDPDLDVRLPQLPDYPGDLDDYLRQSEAAVSDLIPGTEKTIVWANPDERARTPYSIVYLHGFSATRQEVAPLCEVLGRRLGANVYYTRLAGHGHTTGTPLGNSTVNDWLRDTAEAAEIGRMLGDKVILVATSTGGTLSTWLANQPSFNDRIVANVMLSPNFAPKDRNARVALWPWGKQIMRAAAGKLHSWEPTNEMQARYWTTAYPIEAIVEMMSLVDIVDEIDLTSVKLPTLLIYSENDEVVSVEKMKEKFPQFGGSQNRIVALETTARSKSHVLAGDIIAPEMTPVVADVISDYLSSIGIEPALNATQESAERAN